MLSGSPVQVPPPYRFGDRVDPQTAPLTAGTTPDTAPEQNNIDQYIPRALRAKLEAARSRGGMVGERRVVTMLFCDVKGSTEAAGRLDPEDWTEIINGAFEYMIRPVYKYEGTVARLMGDGILAFFGAPIAHEDDPQRAVLAGLDIASGLAPYREAIRKQWDLDINVRVGINTGLVVVGAVGSDLRMEYTAMGDAINLAARMEQTAEPGTIQVAQDTHRQVAHLFEFEDLGGIQVKGKDEPVQAYRVTGRKATAGRKRGIEGLEAQLVGRAQEMKQLHSVMANLSRGVGRIICLMGRAGLGKSRLIQEMKKSLPESAGLEWHEIAAVSYEANVPYALFQQLVRRLGGLVPGEEAALFWQKVNGLAGQVSEDEAVRFTRVFAVLYGMEDPSGLQPLEGELFKRELYAVMTAIWQVRFAGRQTALVLDDLHWADPASIDLLLHLLPTLENNPVVLLCAFRPDRGGPAYRLKQVADESYAHRYTEISLPPLTPEESDQLVNSLLAIADLPQSLRDRIQERSAGNPFYVEEVVRTLIEKGAVVAEDRPENGAVVRHWRATNDSAEIDIPDNLQGLLVSRIDRLEDGTRHIMQLASVIGRSFHYRVLAEIGKPDALTIESIEDQVSRLVRLEMIQEAARVPEIEYKFRNPMTQEIAYQTILLKRRRDFHRRVGEALESLFADRSAEHAPRLAYHFSEAQQPERALKYFMLAGDNAYRLFALKEALHNYEQALQWAGKATLAAAEWIYLHNRLGRTLELLLRNNDALETYKALEELGSRLGDDSIRLAGLAAQGIAYAILVFDQKKSIELSEVALALAREIRDQFTEARCLWGMLLAYTWLDGRRALSCGEQGLAIMRTMAAQQESSIDQIELKGLLLMDLTIPLIGDGQIPAAREYATEARELFERIGNLPMASTSAQRQGLVFKVEGRYAEALESYDHSTRVDVSLGNDGGLIGSSLGLLDIYPQMGDFSAFFDRLDLIRPIIVRWAYQPIQTVNLYPLVSYLYLGVPGQVLPFKDDIFSFMKTESFIWPDMFMCYLARAQLALGKLEEARRSIAAIRPGAGPVNYMIPLAALIPQVQAEMAIAAGDYEAALAYVDDFIALARADGVASFLPEKLLTRGRILKLAGRTDDYRQAMMEGYELALQQRARPFIWQISVHLAEIEKERGNAAKAAEIYLQGRAAVDFIASHAGRDELRASFLSLTEVKQIILATGG